MKENEPMSRRLKVAAVQMDATPAPLGERLSRAADLIAEAVGSGAQLIALPELFNVGYEYSDQNYARAETIHGETVTWMKQMAATHQIYLVGSLMLLDKQDVYNAMLLIAPDGKLWRYDKLYPFLWERAYFREGKGITVAETELGKLGMMVCWDTAHPNLWKQYAGRVDAMLVVSCPPKISSLDMIFPDGIRLNTSELGGMVGAVYTDEEYFPGKDMDAQAAWMNVPVVNTVGGGTIRTTLPLPHLSVANYLSGRPDLWKYLLQAPQLEIEAGFDKQTKIINAQGEVIGRVTETGDGFTLAEIELADKTPQPSTPQPKMRTQFLAYLAADGLRSLLMPMVYRRGLRRQWGRDMAPTDESTRRIQWTLLGLFILRLLTQRRRSTKRK